MLYCAILMPRLPHTAPQAQYRQVSLVNLLRPYTGIIALLVLLTLVASGMNLVVPKIIAAAIDTFTKGSFSMSGLVIEFAVVAGLIFIFTYLQNIVQVYASERVARDLRNSVSSKISLQSYAYIEHVSPARLLTNLTSDIDAVKSFVSQAIASLISSVFLIIGASILLILIDWRLALAVLAVVPIIGITFYLILQKVRPLFTKSQEAIDWLNKVISESILGAGLIRLLNSQAPEYDKFIAANTEAKDIGMKILRLFSSLLPVITFCTNVATLIILALGGHFIITGSMTLGSFTAFTSYLSILIFPVLVIGFMSNVIAQATASYARIAAVLDAPGETQVGGISSTLHGDIAVRDITVMFGDKVALKDVSFTSPAGTRTAIIGPTAAGKTQLLYMLTGLLAPTSGDIEFDGKNITEYAKTSLHSQIGFVFQDSVMFNLSIRENIAFSNTVKDEQKNKAVELAIKTAELQDLISGMPQGLDTIVSERGTSLSGGQKQRIMLARALALNPKILLLDDFIARVDAQTESKILKNIAANYPGLTLISVTQKISSIEHYDQIILLMEGEILARGTHDELLKTSPEYVQIFDSQRNTTQYETQN